MLKTGLRWSTEVAAHRRRGRTRLRGRGRGSSSRGSDLASVELVAKEIVARGGYAEAAEVNPLDERAVDGTCGP